MRGPQRFRSQESSRPGGAAESGQVMAQPRRVPSLAVHAANVAVLFLVSLFFWRGCLDDFFSQDDFLYLDRAMTELKAMGLFKTLAHGLVSVAAASNVYRPLGTSLYFTAMYDLFGLHAAWYHAVSLLLHTINSVLVYAIAQALFKDAILSFLCGAMFLTRSLAYVPVFWASGIQDLLSFTCCLLFIACMIAFFRRGDWRWFALALAVYIAGAHTKELCFPLPLCAIPVWFMTRRPAVENDTKRFLRAFGLLAAGGAVLILERTVFLWGYEAVYNYGVPNWQMLASMVKWTFHGSYDRTASAMIVSGVFFALVILSPYLLRLVKVPVSMPEFPRRSTPLECLGIGAILAATMLFFRDREIEYFAYAPSAFIILGMAAATAYAQRAFAQSAFPHLRRAIYGIAAALLLLSSSVEMKVIQAKDQTAWVATTTTNPDGSRSVAYGPNPWYEWTGGFLNSNLRYKYKRFFFDFRHWIESQTGEIPPVLLVGWIDININSNIRTGGKKLENVPVTGSVLKLAVGDRPITVRTLSVAKTGGVAVDYEISRGQLKEFLASAHGKARVILLNLAEGSIEEVISTETLSEEEVIRRVDKHLGKVREMLTHVTV